MFVVVHDDRTSFFPCIYEHDLLFGMCYYAFYYKRSIYLNPLRPEMLSTFTTSTTFQSSQFTSRASGIFISMRLFPVLPTCLPPRYVPHPFFPLFFSSSGGGVAYVVGVVFFILGEKVRTVFVWKRGHASLGFSISPTFGKGPFLFFSLLSFLSTLSTLLFCSPFFVYSFFLQRVFEFR